MIEIRNIDDLAAPTVICDHCGKPIHDARHGVYLWHPEFEEGASMRVYFAHEGRCHDALEEAHDAIAWMPLNEFPVHLSYNIDVAWGDKETAVQALVGAMIAPEDARRMVEEELGS